MDKQENNHFLLFSSTVKKTDFCWVDEKMIKTNIKENDEIENGTKVWTEKMRLKKWIGFVLRL